jgi:hypothetical protein
MEKLLLQNYDKEKSMNMYKLALTNEYSYFNMFCVIL